MGGHSKDNEKKEKAERIGKKDRRKDIYPHLRWEEGVSESHFLQNLVQRNFQFAQLKRRRRRRFLRSYFESVKVAFLIVGSGIVSSEDPRESVLGCHSKKISCRVTMHRPVDHIVIYRHPTLRWSS